MGTSHLGQRGIPGHIRNISEAARGHSPRAVEGLAQGGGGLLAVPRDGIISNRGGEVSHVFVRGGQIIDSFTRGINQLSGWAENSAVPRVAAAVPLGCDGRMTVEGLGPFSDQNFLSLLGNPPGSDVLDFAGDFSACIVFQGPVSFALSPYLFDNGYLPGPPAAGYAANFSASGAFGFFSYADNSNLFTANVAITAGVVNVVCFGRAGTTRHAKMNLGIDATDTGAVWATGIAYQARIGRGSVIAGRPWPVIQYELWFSAITPSDALFTDIMLEVKGRLGVTAW